jgi:hypothetical protein
MFIPLSAPAQAMTGAYVPEEVFAGHTQGQGELRMGLGAKQSFSVASQGNTQADGRFRLDQDVIFAGKPARSRSWVMWRTGAGDYSASLTDAAGPVTAHTAWNRMTLRYPLTHWGLVMHQTLDLLEDGRTVMNVGSIRFMGIPVGRLEETIRLLR